MRTEINMSPTARPLWGWSGLLLVLLVILPAGLSAADKVPKRHALVYMSDGTEYEGILQLTPGIDLKLTKLPGGGMKRPGPWISTTSAQNRGSSHSILTSSKK